MAACILIALQWLGDAWVEFMRWPIHGSIIGMLLLLGGLGLTGGPRAGLQGLSTMLLRHLMLFLIPSVAGVIAYTGMVTHQLPAILLTLAVSTLVTVAICAGVMHHLMRNRPS